MSVARFAAVAVALVLASALPALATPEGDGRTVEGATASAKATKTPSNSPRSPSIAQRAATLGADEGDFAEYLDRLMMAESDGRDFLRNPRSTALGPYQFIKGTFLYVVRRHFTDRISGMSENEILALRTNRPFARDVIAEYSRELARHLDRNGLATSYGNLRLAYLLGPTGARRVLQADATTPLRRLISAGAVTANPFLARMTAADIIARAHRDIAMDRTKSLAVSRIGGVAPPAREAPSAVPRIAVRCNPALASCRRWLALRTAKTRKAAAGGGGATAKLSRR